MSWTYRYPITLKRMDIMCELRGWVIVDCAGILFVCDPPKDGSRWKVRTSMIGIYSRTHRAFLSDKPPKKSEDIPVFHKDHEAGWSDETMRAAGLYG